MKIYAVLSEALDREYLVVGVDSEDEARAQVRLDPGYADMYDEFVQDYTDEPAEESLAVNLVIEADGPAVIEARDVF